MSILRANVDFAKRIFQDRIGDPYVYGGNWNPLDLTVGTDCSGLVGDMLDACLLGTGMPWQRSVNTESWPYDYANGRPVPPGTPGPKGTIAIASPADEPPDSAALVCIHHGGGGGDSHTNCRVGGLVAESNGDHGTCGLGSGAMAVTDPYWTDWWYLPGPIVGAIPTPAPIVPDRGVTWADVEARLDGVFHTTHIVYTVHGTGQPDPTGPGYPADLARLLNPNVWTWQPVGNYPATAFPMAPSIAAGEAELVRLITEVHPDRTFAMIGYSQGAIVTSNIYDRLRSGDLQKYRGQFIGGVTWGNPRREQGHTLGMPGAVDPGGHGIVTPNLVGTEDFWWDFACGKHMVNSPGQDLYATLGYNGDATSVADAEAIWKIVDKGTISSAGDLLNQVVKILPNPIGGSFSALTAILDALDFFVVHGITAHTSYQFIEPVAGDVRDAWTVALDYLNWLGAAVPARIGTGYAPAVPAPPAPVVPAPVVPIPDPVVPAPAPIPVVPAPAPAPTPVPSTTNGSDNVNNIVTLIKDLPIIVKVLIQFLTVAASVAGTITAVVPTAPTGATVAVAGVGGLIASLVRALTHQPQPKTSG